MPCFSDKLQKNNPLIQKILALKLGKDVKDKKVLSETRKEMEKTKEIKKAHKVIREFETNSKS